MTAASKQPSFLVVCHICGAQMEAVKRPAHLAAQHPETRPLGPDPTPPPSSALRRPPAAKATVPTESTPIILKCWCGTHTKVTRQCDECGVTDSHFRMYAKSNRGIVYICGRCNGTVRDRSFARVDAAGAALDGCAFSSSR
jgi:hypothetical protein